MALSRAMKNLQHDSAIARRGGGNPTGGGVSGMVGRGFERARARGGYNPGPKLQRAPGSQGPVKPTGGGRAGMLSQAMDRFKQARGGTPGRNPTTGGPGLPPRVGQKPPRGQVQIGVPGGRMPRGGVMGGPAGGAGKPRPGAGSFGFAARGGGGTPALQQATAGAKRQAMGQRAAAPAALAKPQGQSVASRIGGRQGPPARRGGMARALGSGGSRRRMLR